MNMSKEFIIPNIKISESEIKSFYDERIDDMPKDKGFDELKNDIRKFLVRKKNTMKSINIFFLFMMNTM